MTLFVPEIHFVNYALFFMLAFFCKVKTYKLEPRLLKLKGRIEILDFTDYFDWQERTVIISEAVKISREILAALDNSKWEVKLRNHNINLSLKAKQDLQKDFQALLFLKYILSRSRAADRAYVISSLRFKFLSWLDISGNAFGYPTIGLLASANIIFDKINLALMNLRLFLLNSRQFIYAAVYNRRLTNIKYIYDGISTREIGVNKDKVTFSWIADDKLIRKEEIVFILPKADFQMKTHAKDYTKIKGLLAARDFAMNAFASKKAVFSCFFENFAIFIRNAVSIFRLEDLMKLRYSLQILKWAPLVESLKPDIYMCSENKLCAEEPAVLYFKAIGIKTILWTYGVGHSSFLKEKRSNAHFYMFDYCNILSENVVVWNNDLKTHIEQYQQKEIKIKINGPVMCGDEEVFNSDKEALCKRFNLPYRRALKYVAVFDAPRPSSGYKGSSAWCPDSISPEFNYLLMRDAHRLLADLTDIFLIYKPKRSLVSGKFFYSKELEKIFADIRQHPRAAILDYNINPWVPFALADLCIAAPFGSPPFAALHYKKPAIFHDAMDIALVHRYSAIPQLISHNYEELKSKAKALLSENNGLFESGHIKFLQGEYPGSDSNKRFREYLRSL